LINKIDCAPPAIGSLMVRGIAVTPGVNRADDRIEPGQGPSLFGKQAAAYAKSRPSYPDELFRQLAGLCSETDLAWDVGCGNGQATLGLAPHFKQVIGSDVSPEQLSQARSADNVEYCLLNAEWPLEQLTRVTPELAPGSVDLVTVAQALHWFDLDRFYTNVQAVLKPAGLLAVWTYSVPAIASNAAANELFQHIYHKVVGPYWAPERALVDECYRSLPFPFETVLRFVDEPWGVLKMTWDMGALMGYLRSWSATQKAIEMLGHNPVEAFRSQFEAIWSAEGEHIVVPLYLLVGRK
jgi:SAM-dependent methyltransferase